MQRSVRSYDAVSAHKATSLILKRVAWVVNARLHQQVLYLTNKKIILLFSLLDQCKFDRVLDCFASRNVTGLQTGPGAPMASQSLCETVKDAMACHKRVRASGAMRGCNSTQNQTLSTVVASVTNLLSYNCPSRLAASLSRKKTVSFLLRN